jgi:hypothetical protein
VETVRRRRVTRVTIRKATTPAADD